MTTNSKRARNVKRTGTLHQASPFRPCRTKYTIASKTNHPTAASNATDSDPLSPNRTIALHIPKGTPTPRSTTRVRLEVSSLRMLDLTELRALALIVPLCRFFDSDSYASTSDTYACAHSYTTPSAHTPALS